MKAKNSLWLITLLALSSAYGGGDIVYEEPTETVSTTSNVGRNGPFVGFEGSYVFDMESNVGTKSVSSTGGASVGINVGAKENCWRALVGFEHYSNDTDGQNYDRTFIQGDYFPLDESYSMGNLMVNPYVGVNVGWLNYKGDGDKTQKGFSYGGEAGFTKSFGDNWDMDMGLRYILSDIEDVDHIGTVNMGLHYYY
jgi:hypothetical protein